MIDDVESTRADIANPKMLHPRGERKISHNLKPTNFEEQLREIDAIITGVATILEYLPLTDTILDLAENKTKNLEYSNSKKSGKELEKLMGPQNGLTSALGSKTMGSVTELPTSQNIIMGQALSLASSIFSLESNITKPSCETKMRKVTGTIQNKNK